MMRRVRSWLPFLTLLSAVCVVGWSSPTAGANDNDYSYGPSIVRVAAVQINSVLFDNATNLANMLARTEEAAANGAQLIVFPECAVNGYRYIDVEETLPYAEKVPGGPGTVALIAKARELGVHIVYGVIEREGINLYDSAVLVGPEGYIGKYRKTHMGFVSEALLFTRDIDTGYPVFQTKIGRIALGVCYDGAMPETARVPALRGVDIHAYVYSGGGGFINNYLLSRAEENNAYVVIAARLGYQRYSFAYGYSAVFAPGWKTLVMASGDQEEVVYADVDLSLLSRSWIHERRPELYGPVAKPLPREIQALDLAPESHVFGSREKVFVRIVTASVKPGLPVDVQFLKGGTPFVRASGHMDDNSMTLPVALPATLPVGDYDVKVTILGEPALTKVGHYTVKAFPYPHAMGIYPWPGVNFDFANAWGWYSIQVGWDMDVVPSTTVPATLTGGGETVSLAGYINQYYDPPDNVLSFPYSNLKPSTSYTVSVPTGAVQTAGGVGNYPLTFTFTTPRDPLIVKAAAAQTNPIKGANAQNLQAMLAKLDEAKAAGAQLVVFPELAVSGTGFAGKGEALRFAEEVPGPAVEAMTARAQELGLYAAFGLLEEASKPGERSMHWGHHHRNKVLYSTFVFVGPEGYIGKYRKAHLSHTDRAFLDEGDMPFQTFNTASIGKVGLMLGDDVRFPEVARVQLAQKATILAIGGNATDAIWRELALSRAVENEMWVVAANRIGSDGAAQYIGRSAICDGWWGACNTEASNAEELVTADLNIDTMLNKLGLTWVDPANGKIYAIDFVRDRRPELYRPLIWDHRRDSNDREREDR